MITIVEEFAVPCPPARVWEVVSSPPDVVSCIAGAELGTENADGSFDGTLAVKFGAIRVRFAARVSLDLTAEEREGKLSAQGRDSQGATRFSGNATFQVAEADSPDTSLVRVRGEIGLTGKLASLIESGARAVVSRMTKEFTAALTARCAVPDTAVSASATRPPERPGLLRRCRAWLAGLLHPRRTNRTHREEVDRGNVQAQ